MIGKYTHNNKVLSAEERENFINLSEQTIDEFNESAERIYAIYKSAEWQGSENHNEIFESIVKTNIFTSYVFADYATLLKLFLKENRFYEKSCLRGKLKVLLNEGFKRIYGFSEKEYHKTYCYKIDLMLSKILKPSAFINEFAAIKTDLEIMSKSHSWWKEIRCAEVHLDIDLLYESRHEPINESQVTIQTLNLLDILNRINNFVLAFNQAYINYMAQNIKQ